MVNRFGPVLPPRNRTHSINKSSKPAIHSSQVNYVGHARLASYPFANISNFPAGAPSRNVDYDDVLLPPPAPPYRKNNLPNSGAPTMPLLRLQTYSPEQSSGISMDELSPLHALPPPLLSSSSSHTFPASSGQAPTVSHLQNIPYSRKPFDMSVDENYEFDTFFPRQFFWSQSATMPTSSPPQLPARQTRSVGPVGEQGGAERWIEKARHELPQYRSYRLPRNIDLAKMEARCAALRQEFLNFRRTHHAQLCLSGDEFSHFGHQREQQDNDDSTSSSSNAFESVC